MYFWWCRYFWSPWVSFMMTDESLVRVSKVISKISVSWTQSLLFQFFPLFCASKKWPYYQKHINELTEPQISLKLCFTNIWGLSWNFVGCKSFLKSNCHGILAQYETTSMTKLILAIFCEGLSSFDPKGFCSHMHSLAYYVKGGLPFAQDLGLENREFLFIFRLTSLRLVSYFFSLYHGLALLHLVSYFFFLYQWSSSLCTVFDAVSSKIDDFLSIIASVECICLWRL